MTLRTALVVDYQNMHMSAHEVFDPDGPVHESLLHPVRLAQAIEARKAESGDPAFAVDIRRIEVFRGLPDDRVDPDGYRRNLAQAAAWRASPAAVNRRLTVIQRPLTYKHYWDATARRSIVDPSFPPIEKGVDVLTALSFVRFAQDPEIDHVIMASRDTDLVPAIEEVQRLGCASVEAVKWYDPDARWTMGSLKTRTAKLWTTSLGREDFEASRDLRIYS